MTGQEKRSTHTQASEAGGLRVAASAVRRVLLCFICSNKFVDDDVMMLIVRCNYRFAVPFRSFFPLFCSGILYDPNGGEREDIIRHR